MMLTPFSHYLQSNQAPSEAETRKLKALRANPLKEISVIDVEIEQIEGILNSLKRKRAHIQESVDDINTILAPVRRLPTDVLGVIFSHCLATHRNPVMSASEAPILLTQICCDWRSVALSIPRLWSRLYIPTLGKDRPTHYYSPEALPYNLEDHRIEARMEARTEEVRRWLRLSGTCPLAITLVPISNQVSYPPFLDTIMQSSRRWQQLELGCSHFPDSDAMTRLFFFSLSPDDLCMLRELRIYSPILPANPSQEVQEDLWYQSGLLTAQGLRSIFIAALPRTNTFTAGIPPNWKNLNHLFIHSSILLEFAHQILTYCCNLVACLLNIAGQLISPFNTIPNASITLSSCILPHLTFLSLQGDFAGCFQVLRNIETPSLQILDYQGFFPASEFDEVGLLNFLQNINSLESLRVGHYGLRVLESKYCTLFPSVTHLALGRLRKPNHNPFSFQNPSAYSEYANYLTVITTLLESRHQYSPDSAPTVLFPSLEIFEAYDISGVTDIILLEFIKARIDATKSNAGVSKLKKVLVEFRGARQTDIIPEALAYAQVAGIKLEIDLTYYTTEKEWDATWSPSFGLSPDDVPRVFPLNDYFDVI